MEGRLATRQVVFNLRIIWYLLRLQTPYNSCVIVENHLRTERKIISLLESTLTHRESQLEDCLFDDNWNASPKGVRVPRWSCLVLDRIIGGL